jgi:hypothetical protein
MTSGNLLKNGEAPDGRDAGLTLGRAHILGRMATPVNRPEEAQRFDDDTILNISLRPHDPDDPPSLMEAFEMGLVSRFINLPKWKQKDMTEQSFKTEVIEPLRKVYDAHPELFFDEARIRTQLLEIYPVE